MRKILGLVVAFLFISGMAWADTKMSNNFIVSKKINDKVDITLGMNTGVRENVEEFNSYFITEGITYHANKNLDLGVSHLFLRNRTLADRWLNENRLELNITPKTKIGNFRLSNRGRVEYRLFEVGKDKTRYRNATTIAYPIRTFTPSLTEEFFYDFKNRKSMINWLIIGLDKKIANNLTLGVFFNYETVRRGLTNEWDANNVLGTKIAIAF